MLTKELPDLQAVIDEERVGKLLEWKHIGDPVVFKCTRVNSGECFDGRGESYLAKNCRPVTREEALAMVYEPEEKSCATCGRLKNACDYCEYIPK